MTSLPQSSENQNADTPQSTHVNFEHNDMDEDDEDEDKEIEVDVDDYLKAVEDPVVVTRTNKIVCTLAFVVLIVCICAYVTALIIIHNSEGFNQVMSDVHYEGPADIIYVLMFTDVVASCVGIWTCLKKTGPKPMIFACVWLLLSSLINLCVTISLTFEGKSFRKDRTKVCKEHGTQSNECTMYTKVEILLWCSLLSFVPKLLAIALCRINYPSVFNWMIGKEVYIDEELLPQKKNSRNMLMRNLGGAYFDPPDIARIAARGSVKNATVSGSGGSARAIFVTKGEHAQQESEVKDPILSPTNSYQSASSRGHRGSDDPPIQKRRTYISL